MLGGRTGAAPSGIFGPTITAAFSQRDNFPA